MSNTLTLNSKIKELYANPVGKDALDKLLLQMNLDTFLLTNPIVANMKVKYLATLTKKKINPVFFEHLLALLNTEKDIPKPDRQQRRKAWWKEAVFYQVYPRSFMDGNGDGIGDLRGIIAKLDYLQDLGIDALWLSPIYASPNDDNGYDISDYYNIMPDFGTMADFEALLAAVHQRGMRLIMDLVVNHTSDEHSWFQQALADPASKYRDYYIFRKSTDGNPPNNWTSFFSGPAWNYYPEQDVYALHLFSKKQMDLNWDNPAVREEIIKMVKWWHEKGVDGFRLDVINYISKTQGLPDGDQTIADLMGYCGVEHFFYGPHLHEYLHQLNQEAFQPYQTFSVGETPGIGMEMSKLLTADYRQELDMVFSFDHLETPGHVRFDDYQYDLNYLKKYLMRWTLEYPSYCQMSLFYENHDNPRMVSKVNPDPQYREPLAKLLAAIQLTSAGTPFIYQGQEIGMVNQDFTEISQLRDVESLNLYEELLEKHTPEAAFHKILAGTRDHARTPMQWNTQAFAGFSSTTPWIQGDDSYLTINVESQLQQEDSILNFYKQLIALRKQYPEFSYGEVHFIRVQQKNLFVYQRSIGNRCFMIECNLSKYHGVPKAAEKGDTLLLSNYSQAAAQLRPYEVNVYRIR